MSSIDKQKKTKNIEAKKRSIAQLMGIDFREIENINKEQFEEIFGSLINIPDDDNAESDDETSKSDGDNGKSDRNSSDDEIEETEEERKRYEMVTAKTIHVTSEQKRKPTYTDSDEEDVSNDSDDEVKEIKKTLNKKSHGEKDLVDKKDFFEKKDLIKFHKNTIDNVEIKLNNLTVQNERITQNGNRIYDILTTDDNAYCFKYGTFNAGDMYLAKLFQTSYQQILFNVLSMNKNTAPIVRLFNNALNIAEKDFYTKFRHVIQLPNSSTRYKMVSISYYYDHQSHLIPNKVLYNGKMKSVQHDTLANILLKCNVNITIRPKTLIVSQNKSEIIYELEMLEIVDIPKDDVNCIKLINTLNFERLERISEYKKLNRISTRNYSSKQNIKEELKRILNCSDPIPTSNNKRKY